VKTLKILRHKKGKELRFVVFFIALLLRLHSAEVLESVWKEGETFTGYLVRNGVPLSLMKTISAEDVKFLSEIQAGEKFYELKENGKLLQALFPIGEEMQIQIVKNLRSGQYRFDIIPIVYRKVHDKVVLPVESNCYSDIDRITHHPRLSFVLKTLYKNRFDFRRLIKGDKIAFEYRQKSRLGKPFGQPIIRAALIYTRRKFIFAYVDSEGNIWHDVKKEIRTSSRDGGKRRGSSFIMPVRGARITSRFTYKRWHPILHRYRPHLGVDWGAKRGTPLYAVNSGKVIFSGWMRGYGKVVKIDHGNGYVSLYAHQSRIKVRRGVYVKRGDIIYLQIRLILPNCLINL
jgi:murein DD-endopeptidase MepM/ murein hydrolase activator NlpD